MIKGTARSTGIWYLIMALPAPITLMYIPSRFFIRGDPAATVAAITSGELVYRLGILAGIVSSIAFVCLVLSLYRLLKNVDEGHARLMVCLVLIASALGLLDLVLLLAPLVFVHGTALSAFSRDQLDGLALVFVRIRAGEIGIVTSLWGLWLVPLGILVLRSGFIPRFIGIFLLIGGAAYIVLSVTAVVSPANLNAVSNIALPIAGPGELSMMIWLLIKGGKVPLPQS
jgi:hypothetical protein